MNKNMFVLMMALSFSGTALAEHNDVQRHGYIDTPKSRALLCREGVNKNCGNVQYEPQSVEGKKGFPQAGPADGQIASGGNAAFDALNQQGIDRWHKVKIEAGKNPFIWTLTARHSTASWKYYITNQNWDPTTPLTRADFDLNPFCEKYDNGKLPESQVKIECNVPERTGYQVILGVWNVADTANAFYQVIDVDFDK